MPLIIKTAFEIFLVGIKFFFSSLFSGLQVESERAYHQRVLQILDQLEGEVCSHFAKSLHFEQHFFLCACVCVCAA